MPVHLPKLQDLLDSAYKLAKKKSDALEGFCKLPNFIHSVQVFPSSLNHYDPAWPRIGYCKDCRERYDRDRPEGWLVPIGASTYIVDPAHAVVGFVAGWEAAAGEKLYFVAREYGNQYTLFMFFKEDPYEAALQKYEEAVAHSVMVA